MMTTKAKKVLSPEQLEKLKVARDRALAVRQQNAGNKAAERELIAVEKEKHYMEVKEKLAKVKDPASAVMGERLKPKVIPVEPVFLAVSPVGPAQAVSESESEPEVVVKKVKKKVKKKIVIVEDSDSDEEQQQVIYVKKKKPAPEAPRVTTTAPTEAEPPKPDPYERQYNSIFNARLRY